MVKDIYIVKEPIVDKNENIFGYKLEAKEVKQEKLNMVKTSIDTLKYFTSLDLKKINPLNKPLFVEIGERILDNEVLNFLKDKNLIFILDDDFKDERDKALSFLKELSIPVCLDVGSEFDLWLDYINQVGYLRVSIDEIKHPQRFELIKSIARKYNILLIGKNVNHRNDFELLKEEGFFLFEGSFYEKVIVKTKTVDPKYTAILNIYNLLKSNSTIDKIENAFKASPELSIKLLTMINSPFFGLRSEIKSIRQAVTLIGYDKLSKWILFLLFGKDPANQSSPLLEKASVRGKMMEELAKIIKYPAPDEAFLTGMLSLAYVALDMDLESFVNSLSIAKEVKDALLNREGVLGIMLNALESFLNKDFDKAISILKENGYNVNFADLAKLEELASLFVI